jgi:hypothetical protein
MSNPEEDYRLASLAYNKLEAKAIATGILNYFRATRNLSVDFTSIFAPLDDQAEAAQTLADATIVRKKVVEKKSLFGSRFQEVTFDATGRVISRRDIGGGSTRSKERSERVVAQAGKSRVSSSVNKRAAVVAKKGEAAAKPAQKNASAKGVALEKKAKANANHASKGGKTSSTKTSSKK